MGREENGKENGDPPREDGTAWFFCAVSGWYLHSLLPSLAF
jgi:hypothetical protein